MPKSDDLKNRLEELFSSSMEDPDQGFVELDPGVDLDPGVVLDPSLENEPAPATEMAPAAEEVTQTLFQTPFEYISLGMCLTGTDARFIHVNQALSDMLGYSRDELTGKSFQEVTYPDDEHIGADTMRAMIAGDENNAHIQKRYITKDGRRIWVELNVTLVRDIMGEPDHFVTFIQDISQQKRTSDLLERRVRELDCLSDIGHRMDERPSIPELLQWITDRVPKALPYAEDCVVAIEYKDQVFGAPEATELSSKIVGGLRVSGNLLGWVHFAYTQPHEFADADSALVGRIVSRLNSYLESTTAFEQAQQRSEELATVAQVSTTAAAILDSQELLQAVVDLTKERFSLYHAHIYLLDETGDNLVLQAGAGEAGKQMVGQGWQIAMGSERSLVARAARDRRGAIVNDVRSDPGFLPNDLLPDTASEMAVPLIAGEELLGVLDVQSNWVDYFTNEDVNIQTTLAYQVAGSLQNARLYERSRQALLDTRESQALLQTIIDATPDWIFIKDQEHRHTLVNRSYADSMHLEPDDFIGKTDLEVGFPEDLVKGNPEKGIVGFWVEDRRVMDSGETKIVGIEPVVVDDEQRFLSTLKVPLRNEAGEVWGVLGFVRDVTDQEKLLSETELQAQRLATLTVMSTMLSAAQNTDEVLTIVCSQVLYVIGGEHASLALVDPSGESFEVYALSGDTDVIPKGKHFPIDGTAVGVSIRENRLITLPDESPLQDFMDGNEFRERGVRCTISAPVAVAGNIIGALSVASKTKISFTRSEKDLMGQVVAMVAATLESHHLLEQIQNRAKREQTLREITTRVRGSTDPDTIMRTAVRELGSVLGRRTFVKLGNADQLALTPIDLPDHGNGPRAKGDQSEGDS